MAHEILSAALALAVVALLVSERGGHRLGVWVSKTTASALFVAIALSLGALETPYGRLVLAGLGLSLAGDVLLIPKDPRSFRAGLAAFLFAHLLYVAAFIVHGVRWSWAGITVAPLSMVGWIVMRRLWPHVPRPLRGPVVAYVVAISAMLCLALATLPLAGTASIPAGAALFYLSDLSVARDRFVAPGFINRLWGLPAYYAGQVLLAWSVSG